MSDTDFDTLFDDKARAAHAAGPVGYDEEGVRQAVRLFLKSIGEDPDREGLLDTPDRIGRACKELFAGLGHGPEEVLKTRFKVDTDEMVLVRDIELFSVCEHHLLPFHGVAHVGYIPQNGQVAGLSKLARLVELYARRPQVQERLTQQVADALMEGIDARGVIVVTECDHMCMAMRGVKKAQSRTVTSAVRGCMRDAATRTEAMMKAGADIIDIGAESTRPGAKRVSEADEKARVLGAVDALIPEGAVLSIDTTRASVALAALEHGAQIINDVSGGQLDRELPHVVADHSDCLYIVQHWRGWLAGAAGNVPDADTSRYEHGVVNDVYDELMRQVDAVLEAGVQAEQVIIDPGLGFSKPGVEHNLPILAALDRFNAAGYPVLIGASRKRFVGSLLAGAGVTEPDMASKDNATAAISALCAEHGVWAVRVHDVAKSRDAVAVGNAWREYANA